MIKKKTLGNKKVVRCVENEKKRKHKTKEMEQKERKKEKRSPPRVEERKRK